MSESKKECVQKHVQTITQAQTGLVKDLSEKTGITLKDSKYILRAFNQVLFERLAAGESIRFYGVGTINVRNVGPTKIYSPIINDGKGGYIDKDPFYKFSFTPSPVLRKMMYFDESEYVNEYEEE